MAVVVALDFETSDKYADSACALGMVRMENGRVVSDWYSLIRPPRSRVYFTEIHGLTWEMLKDRKSFAELWPDMAAFMQGAELFVAHNATFDRRVLHGCCRAFGLIPPSAPFVCTVKGSRRRLRLPHHRLNDVCDYLGLELDHHNAEEMKREADAVIDRNHPETIIAARKSSPLVVGIGEDEYFLASDATPIVEYTNKVIYLSDGEIAVLRNGEPIKIVDLDNVECSHEAQTIALNIGQLQKGGYPHFMIKEIFDQPECIADCMRGRLNPETMSILLSAVKEHREKFIKARRFIIVACGTSWHAGLIGKQLIETMCRIPVEVEYASEFRYRNPVISPDDVVMAISQSGETADTLAAIELAHSSGAFVYGICNVVGSSIARATDSGSYIHVGPEIGVASTKAFTGQVTVLLMFALSLAQEMGTISTDEYKEIVSSLNDIPEKMRQVLKQNDYIASLSRMFTYARNFIYLGRGYSFPIALEGALKLKEISYIHAEGYPAAEMKHGPIALIDAEMPVVVIATNSPLYDKVLSNIQEIKARGGRVVAIVTEGDTVISSLADFSIPVPAVPECLDALVTSIPLQLMAYHIAVRSFPFAYFVSPVGW